MNKNFTIQTLAVIVLVAIIAGVGLFINFNRSEHTNCVVNTVSTFSVEGEVQKRVYTENCGEFTVNDNLLTGTFNSGSIYGSIKEGGVYNFTATGIRWHLPTLFPNIIHAEAVTAQ